MSSEETKKKVTELVDPIDDFIRVKNIRKVRNGDILVETMDKGGGLKKLGIIQG